MSTTTTKTRRVWSDKEDETLREAANKQQACGGPVKDWNKVALGLPGRTNKDCRKRWGKISKEVKKGPWDAAEDQRLQQAVQTLGPRWTNVAELVGTRHADQCAKRWTNSLDPELDQSSWKPREDEVLMSAVERRGHDWKSIAKVDLPGRSKSAIKNRYAITQNRRRRQQGIDRASVTAFSRTGSPTVSDDEDDSDDDGDEDMGVDGDTSGPFNPRTTIPTAGTIPHATISAELQMDATVQTASWNSSAWDMMDSGGTINPTALRNFDPMSCDDTFDMSSAFMDQYNYDNMPDFSNPTPTHQRNTSIATHMSQSSLGSEQYSGIQSQPDGGLRPPISTSSSSSSNSSAASQPSVTQMQMQQAQARSPDMGVSTAMAAATGTPLAPSYKTTLELYNVSEAALGRIMSIAIQNRIKVRLELQHNGHHDAPDT